MAYLNEADRETVWAEMMEAQKARTGQNFGAITKADLRSAVDGLDAFLEDNAASINSAIPQPARAELTQQQKALLLQFVIAKRYLRS